ncbi:low specificity L-threonine aldolase [Enteractinococcus fodinae]|uniref:Threonine aldolase n=1 Tax=Enteractinococcus fodinae TaxID=684663 RepID=A0ABU2AXT0_9MICC|nr:beta-eliminating lyase-related protein [Enteractinococcus fodinae]MDR7346160.1 threonine aldolase [Enteractinococcus fodinae]
MKTSRRFHAPGADPHFASDNISGAHPEIMAALAAANTDAPAYGADEITDEFHELIDETFGSGAYGFPVFNGTGANIVALQAVSHPHSSVICADTAHVYTSESSAPVRAGLSLKPQPHREGKLNPADVAKVLASDAGNPQAVQPTAVTISQVTEMGTVYTAEELTELCNTVHEAGLAIHMDGARLSQAAAALGQDLHGATTALGVDILSLGATKNGAMGADAVVVLSNRVPQDVLAPIIKYSTQLASKTSFLSAQLNAMFGTSLWHRNATAANTAAAELAAGLATINGVDVQAPAANTVLAAMPERLLIRLREHYIVHLWGTNGAGLPIVRLVCSWATTSQKVTELLDVLRG